jgi:hypothetical protein
MSTTMGQAGQMGSGQGDRDRQSGQGQGGQMSQGLNSQMSQGYGGGGQMSQSQQHAEGTVARTIEQQTAKLPSDVFLWAALGSIGTSAILKLMGKNHASLFVGDWVAPLLLFGVYNKIVKVQGSDRMHGH